MVCFIQNFQSVLIRPLFDVAEIVDATGVTPHFRYGNCLAAAFLKLSLQNP